MKALGVVAMLVVALMMTLAFGGAQADSTSTPIRNYYLHLDGEFGYRLAGDTFRGNPGPTLTALDNETMVITLTTNDNYTHAMFIDLNNDTLIEQGEPIGNFYTSGYYPTTFTIPAGGAAIGSYVYRDYTNTKWYGLIVIEKHYEPWFKWDPFFIFGLLMVFAVVGWIGYVILQGARIARNRRRIKATNPGIIKWVKAVMDPDSPTRPTQDYVDHIRVEKKRRRKAEVTEMKQRRNNDPPKPPSSGNDNLGLG